MPIRYGIHLSKKIYHKTPEERKRMSKIPYASTMGSIIYAMLCTRSDIAYALDIASRFQVDPEEDHYKAVKNILKYLKRTKDIFSYIWRRIRVKTRGLYRF